MAVIMHAILDADGSHTFWRASRNDPEMTEHPSQPDPANYTISYAPIATVHEMSLAGAFVADAPLVAIASHVSADAAATEVTFDNLFATLLKEDYVYDVELVAKAYEDAGGTDKSFVQRQHALVYTPGAVPTLGQGSPSTIFRSVSDLLDLTWDAVIGVSGTHVTVTVTGLAATDIHWDIILRMWERQQIV